MSRLYFFLSDEIDCPRKITFAAPTVKRPKYPPKEANPPPPRDSPEFITFKILKRQPPRFLQDNNPQSFHACLYRHGKGPSSTSSRFHHLEDDDIDTSLPWCLQLDDSALVKLVVEVSCQEYINQRRKIQAKMNVLHRWGFRRRTFYEDDASQRSPPRRRGAKFPLPSSYH